MATASRHSSGPHGSGASLEEMRGWRAFLHLASELKLSRLARLAYPYRRRAVLSVVAMVVVTLSSLAVPYLLKVAIDGGIGAKDMTVLTWVIAAFIGVSLLNLGASYLQTYLTSWVGEHVIYDLRRQLFAHLQKLSLDFFSRQKTGWIVSRLTNDVDAIDQLVTDGVTTLVTNSLTLVGAVVLLFILDWRLALATLIVMPFLIAATLVFRSRSARAYADVRNKIGDVSAHLQESISGVKVLKAFRREQSDGTYVEQTGFFAGIGTLASIHDTSIGGVTLPMIVFRNSNDAGSQLLSNHYINIRTSPSTVVRDAVAPPNVPAANNRKVRVVPLGEVPFDPKPFPNPAAYDGRLVPPGSFFASYSSSAEDYVTRGGGGFMTIFRFSVPDSTHSQKITLRRCIYDVAGNIVQQAEEKDLLKSVSDSLGAEAVQGGKLVLVKLYWNGFNSKGMPVAPGIYREVLLLNNAKALMTYGVRAGR
jgi:hypothetical protein